MLQRTENETAANEFSEGGPEWNTANSSSTSGSCTFLEADSCKTLLEQRPDMDNLTTEKGKTQRDAEEKKEDMSKDGERVDEANQETVQPQGLVEELRDRLHAALMELCELRQRDHDLEEKLQAHQTDMDEKIIGIKNSLNTFKEELSMMLHHTEDVSSRQIYIQNKMDLLHSDTSENLISVRHRKKFEADVLTTSGKENTCELSQSENTVVQPSFAGQIPTVPPQRSAASTQTFTSVQETQRHTGYECKSPAQGERRNSKDEMINSPTENNMRQRAALELLESERVYVSHLSLLLKANISFNSSEALMSKNKRPFPSSLRFLIQQHLQLLHTLQERVLKCQWQGIMGDVFMRLTSKGSDFLDFYVSYLKELPNCLAVVTMLTSSGAKSSTLFENDIVGDESKLSLHTLLLQPVQRIPEYLLLLQGLLRQTEPEHPDYYLLLVCSHQFKSFMDQYHHLLQHNQDLLLHRHKEAKRSSTIQMLKTESGLQGNSVGSPYPTSCSMLEHGNKVKRSKHHLLEQIPSCHFHNWDGNRNLDFDPHRYDSEWPSQLQLFSANLDSQKTGLDSIPESNVAETFTSSSQHYLISRPTDFRHIAPGTALAEAVGEFLPPPEGLGTESLFRDGGGSLGDVHLYDHCSTASSDSSIDIAFVKCPKAPPMSYYTGPANMTTKHEVDSNSRSQRNGYNRLLRGSPDDAPLMRRSQHRSLQASQCESKDSAFHSWGDESKQMDETEENNHTPFSERSRKQDKGGFRSSFKKLFKKKSTDEKKDKGGEKTQENQSNGEQDTSGKTPKLAHVEFNSGTAV
ncbi:rho guanine nucleotide exchange factor 33 isoform X2 [Thalassophryne amazonica]|uniref:rho guanine nucleotide exchange factor 33 isoform X2 n=1 Tax=Thalassophryne amazonica TaxID=390379 RepID=UPI0014723B80|nr:rho guanine nucleotide exchange factor 33 isoform X2 [Thalassophryne amazonica]